MKIRCENCYKILEPQEEYCTYCGTHSEKIAQAMKTGNYSGGKGERLKLGLIIFLVVAFLGNGLMNTIFAVVRKDATRSLFNNTYSLLVTSFLLTVLICIIFFKDLKDFFWNGNNKQLLGSAVLGTLFIAIGCLFSKISSVTRVIPTYMTDYLYSGSATFFGGESTNIFFIVVSLIMVAFCEEVICRRLLIDTLDENTMLSDFWIIVFGGAISTVLDFAWLMSPETLIVSFLSNLLLTGIYANTNRSLGVNIVLRVLMIVAQILIFIR